MIYAFVRLAIATVFGFDLFIVIKYNQSAVMNGEYFEEARYRILLHWTAPEFGLCVACIKSVVVASRHWKIDGVLSSLKHPKVDQVTGNVEADDVCDVCLEKMTSAQTVDVGETACGHMFHFKCLAAWLRVNLMCPNCCRKLLWMSEVKVME